MQNDIVTFCRVTVGPVLPWAEVQFRF